MTDKITKPVMKLMSRELSVAELEGVSGGTSISGPNKPSAGSGGGSGTEETRPPGGGNPQIDTIIQTN